MTIEAANPHSDTRESPETLEVELRDPRLAAFLGWLIPGAGHFYQGRYAKGVLFMSCILGIYFFGMYLGEGHVVYASFRGEDRRLPYLCQVGVGLPALPAVVQTMRMRNDERPKAPLWNGWMAPPRLKGDYVPNDQWAQQHNPGRALREPVIINQYDELSEWNMRLHSYFELGTVYTMIAGLLNVLAIYDAYGGPLLIVSDEEDDKDDKDDSAPD